MEWQFMYDIIKSQLGVGFIAILSILVLLIIFVLVVKTEAQLKLPYF